jgi:lipoyl(octanoyl) transferase
MLADGVEIETGEPICGRRIGGGDSASARGIGLLGNWFDELRIPEHPDCHGPQHHRGRERIHDASPSAHRRVDHLSGLFGRETQAVVGEPGGVSRERRQMVLHAPQRTDDFRHRLLPLVRPLGEHFRERLLEHPGNVRAKLAEPRDRLLAMRQQTGHVGPTRVGRGSGEQKMQRAAETVDVGASVDEMGIGRLLGGHEVDGPYGEARIGEALVDVAVPCQLLQPRMQPRQAQIEHLDHAVVPQQQVARLDIAVDDVFRMGVFKSERRLQRAVQSLLDLEGPLAADFAGEVHAADKIHHQKIVAFDLAGVERGDDVRMRQRRSDLDLPPEPLHRFDVLRLGRQDELHRDVALHQHVMSAIDLAHAAVSNGLNQQIAAEHELVGFSLPELFCLIAGKLAGGEQFVRDGFQRLDRLVALETVAEPSEVVLGQNAGVREHRQQIADGRIHEVCRTAADVTTKTRLDETPSLQPRPRSRNLRYGARNTGCRSGFWDHPDGGTEGWSDGEQNDRISSHSTHLSVSPSLRLSGYYTLRYKRRPGRLRATGTNALIHTHPGSTLLPQQRRAKITAVRPRSGCQQCRTRTRSRFQSFSICHVSQSATTRPAAAGHSDSLEVRLLGMVDFDSATALQEWLVYELSGRADTQGALLLCEHPPVISIGREGSRGDVQAEDRDLESARLDLRWVSRGGGAVLHCPGQLAVYPLLPLDRLGLGVAEYRRRLESALLDVCHEARVPAKRLENDPGLWSRGGQIAHFGATVKSWVSQHGIWLNVCPEPAFLRMIRSSAAYPAVRDDELAATQPEGSLSSRVTSLQDQLLRRIPMHKIREATIRHVAAAFGYSNVHTYTGHPQLTRTQRRVCVRI